MQPVKSRTSPVSLFSANLISGTFLSGTLFALWLIPAGSALAEPAASGEFACQDGDGKRECRNPAECIQMGQVCRKAGKYPRALGYYESACALNSGEGCNLAGVSYGNGTGTAKSPIKMVQLFIQTTPPL